MTRRFVVLDRDGTIIVEREYLSDPRGVELLPGAVAGLRHLRSLGLRLVVVTNQSGVGRGYFDEAQLERINARMLDLLATEGVHLDGLYYCPHMPEDRCTCRKPQPGLLLRAAEDFEFDPPTSFVVGDKVADIELGRRVGATTLLVRTGYGVQVESDRSVSADHVVDDLEAAARVIETLLV
jgi:D-glycero-D-manno-heptose 1,7-bisphosphate phosphatase